MLKLCFAEYLLSPVKSKNNLVIDYNSFVSIALLEHIEGVEGDAEGDAVDFGAAVVTIQAEGVAGFHPQDHRPSTCKVKFK